MRRRNREEVRELTRIGKDGWLAERERALVHDEKAKQGGIPLGGPHDQYKF